MANKLRIVRQHQGVVPPPPNFQLDKDGKINSSTLAALTAYLGVLSQILNGGLRLGDDFLNSAYSGNFDGHLIEFTTSSTPGADVEVPHGLERVPLGRIILGTNGYGALADTNIGGWGPKRIFLKGELASQTFKLWLV